ARMHAYQFFTAVTKAVAGLTIDVDEEQLVVVQEEGVGRVVDEGAKARFAGAALLLGLAQLGDVLHHAELARRLPRLVPGHVALAVDDAHRAVRANDPVLAVVARAAAHRDRRSLRRSRPVVGMDQVDPA